MTKAIYHKSSYKCSIQQAVYLFLMWQCQSLILRLIGLSKEKIRLFHTEQFNYFFEVKILPCSQDF